MKISIVTSVLLVAFAAVGGRPVSADDDLLTTVSKMLLDNDKDVRVLGLEQVRDGVKGEAATRQLAALLPKMSPEGQVSLVIALGDRGDKAALPQLLPLIGSSSAALRAAAVRAVGAIGGKDEVAVLAPLLGQSGAEQDAAAAILNLRGVGVHEALLAEANRNAVIRGRVYPLLVTRYAIEAVPGLLAAAQDSDEKTRTAALDAIGQLGGPDQVVELAKLYLRVEGDADRKRIERTLTVLAERTGKVDSAAAPLMAFMETQSPADKVKLFSALGRIGGKAALKAVLAAMESSDSRLREAGFQALCNWPDGTVAARLAEIASKSSDEAQRAMAVEALIRVAPLPNNKARPESDRSDKDRLTMLKKAMELSTSKQQKTAILRRASAIHTYEAFQFVLPFLDDPEYAQTSAETIVAIAHHKNVRHAHRAEFETVLDRVMRISKNPRTIDEAKRYREDRT